MKKFIRCIISELGRISLGVAIVALSLAALISWFLDEPSDEVTRLRRPETVAEFKPKRLPRPRPVATDAEEPPLTDVRSMVRSPRKS